MKFIHLTDTHVISGNQTLYGASPLNRLELAVDSINAEHDDAENVIITGDLTHWGEADAYAAFFNAVNRLKMPYILLMGNHDDNAALRAAMPTIPRDENGFVQQVLSTSAGPFIITDTKADAGHQGVYCAKRCAWLDQALAKIDSPALIFMHHPPFKVGITSIDQIRMLDGDSLYAVLDRHRSKVRQLFFGHVHRAINGNWRGFPFSIMRGLNHQVTLALDGGKAIIKGDFATPAYGVILVQPETVICHLHCFLESTPVFDLHNLKTGDSRDFALSMKHKGWQDFTRTTG